MKDCKKNNLSSSKCMENTDGLTKIQSSEEELDEKSIFKNYEETIDSLNRLSILLDPTPSGTGKTWKLLAPEKQSLTTTK